MRPVFQILVAGAVVAAATVAWAIDGSWAQFQGARSATLTFAWNMKGEGKGKTVCDVTDGILDFNAEGWYCNAAISRDLGEGTATGFSSIYLPRGKVTNTVYRAGVNTKKLDAETAPGWLNTFEGFVNNLVSFEDQTETKKFHPILGNVTVTWGSAAGTGRVFKDFTLYNIDQKVSFKGTVATGENAGKAISGTVTLKARNCPRTFPSKQ